VWKFVSGLKAIGKKGLGQGVFYKITGLQVDCYKEFNGSPNAVCFKPFEWACTWQGFSFSYSDF
jgi:hypothetical protein